MINSRIKFNTIVQNQFPDFVKESYPLLLDFLKQYYIAVENQGSTLDILQNIDRYVKVDLLSNLVESTILTSDITFFADTINVQSTEGFPNTYGLIQIDDEIITYTEKTDTSFIGCVRGFSGITSYKKSNTPDNLVFEQSLAKNHNTSTSVKNLSILFLKEFLVKVKRQITPGLEGRDFFEDLNDRVFLKQAKNLYETKGTEESFKILFRALYGKEISIIRPSEFLIRSSDAGYRVTKDIVVESIEGNPLDLINKTIYQDKTEIFDRASATVNNVERERKNGRDYYILSLDYDLDRDINVIRGSSTGNFPIHPTAYIIGDTNANSSILTVDSTIGFPESGKLLVKIDDFLTIEINYTSKNYNQFLGCTSTSTESLSDGQFLRFDAFAYGYSGIGTENIVKFRVTGVLSSLNSPGDSNYDENQKINTKTLGFLAKDFRSNSWLFNAAPEYKISEIVLESAINKLYNVTTIDQNIFYRGDNILIKQNNGNSISANVVDILGSNSFTIKTLELIDISISTYVSRLISKCKSNISNISGAITNVQNVYLKAEKNPSEIYVASNSLPSYDNISLNLKDRSKEFTIPTNTITKVIQFTENHGYYTGDAVSYVPADENNKITKVTGTFYVKVLSETSLSLSKGRVNLEKGNFVELTGNGNVDKLEFYRFANKKPSPQKLIRKISNPIEIFKNNNISSGTVGILVNGVEILSYKSKDNIYYGELETIDVITEGNSYDVINPPTIEISDSVGSGASAYCSVEGSLVRVDVLDSGFGYLETPQIIISGGNGKGAKAEPNMISTPSNLEFNASSGVDTGLDTIGFSTYHGFFNGEKVSYNPLQRNVVSGLSTGSFYYVSVVDDQTIKLHNTLSDSLKGQNEVDLTLEGEGIQILTSTTKKFKIASVSVVDGGSGYSSKKVLVTSSGISTVTNYITSKNHGFNSGDLVDYNSTISDIGGLVSGRQYFITKIDKDNFTLSNLGNLSSNVREFLYVTGQEINLTSSPSGDHIFSYPQIKVDVIGPKQSRLFSAKLNPIFRGSIKNVYLTNGGVSYGSSEILNYERQPTLNILSGSNAEIRPIITEGVIKQVIVDNKGSGYSSTPDITITSTSGFGAILSPVVENGKIVEVKVVKGGQSYSSSSTRLSVSVPGKGFNFKANIKSWNINLVERLKQSGLIVDNDGVLDLSLQENSLLYSHAYSPRLLRRSLYSKKIVNGQEQFFVDLPLSEDAEQKEIASEVHSPIIGWAYDGNPIYGPYGYDTPTGGPIRSMVSGYEEILDSNRPPFASGFFVEDFKFTGNGDLDEYNGRFTITPEYPNGVYAYFTTIDNGNVVSSGPFKKYKDPKFPYFIGNQFKSKIIDFNYDKTSNQDDFPILEKSLYRNSHPFNFERKNTNYIYTVNPNRPKNQTSTIEYTEKSTIDSFEVVSSGDNYKVGDKVVLNNDNSGGSDAFGDVKELKGRKVVSVATSSIFAENVEFFSKSQGTYVGITSIPFNFSSGNIVYLDNISDPIFSSSESYKIATSSNTLTLKQDVQDSSVTGIVTYFNVSGVLNLVSDDIYQINSEKVKILNIDKSSYRIRVLREYDGTIGTAHTSTSKLVEQTRRIEIESGISTDYNYGISKVLYFNPEESLGIGTTGKTISFSNPGVGQTQTFVPSKSIYYPNHGLKTGDRVEYNLGNGESIEVDDFNDSGISTTLIPSGTILYVGKVTDNLFEISQNKIGVGNSGSFVGIGTTRGTLSFVGVGTGEYHSFKTIVNNKLTANVTRNLTTVSTSSTHGLLENDIIGLNIISRVTKSVDLLYPRYTESSTSTNYYYKNTLIVDRKEFTESAIDSENNIITIPDHGFVQGEKLTFLPNKNFYNETPTYSGPYSPLVYGQDYYCIYISDDKIKLATSFYNASLEKPISISFSSTPDGSQNALAKINPKIVAYRDQSIRFNLSDSSLSYFNGVETVSAFTFDFYTDSNFRNKFYSSKTSPVSEIVRNGDIGVSPDAYVQLNINKNVPKELYYKLTPVIDENLPDEISTLETDVSVSEFNKLKVLNSFYNGSYSISGVTSTTYDINIGKNIEEFTYLPSYSEIKYVTNSKNAIGPISKVKAYPGRQYEFLPYVNNIETESGSGAVLDVKSKQIGRISSIKIDNIGFDYSSDLTLAPQANFPQIMKINPLTILDSIIVTNGGKNYSESPDLLLFDSTDNSLITDVIIEYDLGDPEVTIVKNTNGFNRVVPSILPINNSNGLGISSITYNDSTKDVELILSGNFSTSNSFPFSIGDKILIENVSVQSDPNSVGYNSKNYNYALFEITNTNLILGSFASITYNLSDYLTGSQIPGVFDADESLASVVPQKYFPTFDIKIKSNNYVKGEVCKTKSNQGRVLRYDSNNQTLTVQSEGDFIVGEILEGNSSNTRGEILSLQNVSLQYDVSSSSIVTRGWSKETGKLNSSLQRIPDNDYYQEFSYSINSPIEYTKWENLVSSTNHIAGFKKFSDLNIDSVSNLAGVGETSTSILSATFDLVSNIDTGCVQDYDFATERSIDIGGSIISKEIDFKNTKVTNYILCINNRVLTIDDISSTFDGIQNGFDLKYKGLNIFERTFDGSNSNVVDLSEDFITIENHFFVTGEEIEYNSPTPIGISPTNIPGIGVTDILPSSLYVIKVNDIGIRVAASAADALQNQPVPLDLNSLGAGTTHTFTAKNKNQKTIISLDNTIQSPVSITNITTTLSGNVGIADTVIGFVGITSFFNGDLVQIDDEILKVITFSYNGVLNDALVQRGWMGTEEQTHSSGATITKMKGNYNIVNNKIYFYESPYGELYDNSFTGLSINSKFKGRVFLRSGLVGTGTETYAKNYLFDDISTKFDGTTSQFTLSQLGSDVNIGSEDGDNPIVLVRNVLQSPPSPGGGFAGDYNLITNSGITTISFTGTGADESQSYDPNRFGLPLGGIIEDISTVEGLGYQTLVSAAGTAIVSIAGTIQSVSISNSGLGYRNNQTINVGVASTSVGNYDVFKIGTATVSNGSITSITITDGGSGYNQSSPPLVFIDSPLPYSNIPLVYSSSSPSIGIGTGAEVSIVVGSGSSIIDFNLVNTGYGYKPGEILTIPILGSSGIQTNTNFTFSEFQVSVTNTFEDNFSGWYLGGISVFDQIENKFNGIRTKFPLKIQQENYSIEKIKGSPIEIQSTLVVLINDVLQEPNVSYTFTGGANIEFTNPPVEGDTCKILFYNGTTGVDTQNIDIVETIKIGDTVQLNDSDPIYQQNKRVVFNVLSSSTIETNPYLGPGINIDTKYERSLSWCKQREDLNINGEVVGKGRLSYEPLITPTSNIIQPVSIASSEIFVDNLYISFNPFNENPPLNYNNSVKLVSGNIIEQCIASPVVSPSGSITSITINNLGIGYTSAPRVSISSPSLTGTQAVANATINGLGQVNSISLVGSNSGYDQNNPPSILIEPPVAKQEIIEKVSYEGDYGIITGVETTNIGVSTGIVFDFYIPNDSYLRDSNIAQITKSTTGIQTGYYFVVKNSNIGNGVLSLDSSNSPISSGSTFLDNVYQVISVSSGISSDVFGETTPQFIKKVTVSVESYNGLSGIGYSQFFGEFSWGKINVITDGVNRRKNPKEFEWNSNGIVGVTTSSSLTRINPLKFNNYNVP